MNYCVYFLKDKNKVVRYIGSGTIRRTKDIKHSSRSLQFREIFHDGGELLIVQYFSSRDEAVDCENQYLDMYLNSKSDEFDLINKAKSRRERKLDARYLATKLIYDESSPTKLRWNYDKVKSNGRLCSKARIGYVAGTKTSILIDGLTYGVHRVVWALVNQQEIPRHYVINHIDGNPENNSISNLELCTQKENICKIVNNKLTNTGIRGVSLKSNHGIPEQLVATSYINSAGKQIHKYFSVSKYGKDIAIKMAFEWRKENLMLCYPSIYLSML